jgi:DNA-binding transcriptional MerR regulator
MMGVTRHRDRLTISEVVEVVRALDSRPELTVSARQLRYWDVALSFAAGRATEGVNAARLFTIEDVVVVRLVRRLQRDGVAARAIWGVLLMQGAALRAACRPGSSRVLWMEPNGRAHLLTTSEAAKKPTRECYPLADVVTGIAETVRGMRAGDYEVWNGAKAVSVKELAAA